MSQYRKKPVVIEAMQFDGTKESANHVLAWIGGNGGVAMRVNARKSESGLLIETLEDSHVASSGDFVIRGVQGEFYPCKPDIFAATYEPVE